jgi:predicted ATP-grasp superfamily ATP-dependent carboligase
MGIPVLLAATAIKWASPARLPRELARAGFDVAVMAPKGALVTKSRYVATVSYLPDTATPMHWMYMLSACVESCAPRLIVPCDDTTLQLMMSFVDEPPKSLNGPLCDRLLALISESLGDPRYYRTSIDKTLLPVAAEALGVRVPSYAAIDDVATARAFVRTHGYPVVLKRAFGTAGDSVEVVPDEARLEPAFRKLQSSVGTSVWKSDKLLIQAWIPGKGLLHAVAAWGGTVYAGMTREVLMRYSATGPSTVVRCRHAPEARRFSGLLAAGFGISGFFGPEFIEHDETGDVYLIEINRRVTNGVQLGGVVGVDLCCALAAALSGSINTKRTDLPIGEEHLIAEFPQEWLRDPASPYLRSARTDVPWDDPHLLRAMLAMRHA